MPTENREIGSAVQVRADLPPSACSNLIEGALRSTRRTLKLWREFEFDEALESLIEARQSISKLIAELPTDDLPASEEVEAKYVHMLSMLIEAQQSCDAYQLAEVIGILEADCAVGQQTSEEPSVTSVPPPSAAFAARAELKSTIVSKRAGFSIDA